MKLTPWNTDKMAHASFATKEAAISHRNRYGGWIFEPTDLSEYVWFDASITPTQIMQHRATSGMSGRLF